MESHKLVTHGWKVMTGSQRKIAASKHVIEIILIKIIRFTVLLVALNCGRIDGYRKDAPLAL